MIDSLQHSRKSLILSSMLHLRESDQIINGIFRRYQNWSFSIRLRGLAWDKCFSNLQPLSPQAKCCQLFVALSLFLWQMFRRSIFTIFSSSDLHCNIHKIGSSSLPSFSTEKKYVQLSSFPCHFAEQTPDHFDLNIFMPKVNRYLSCITHNLPLLLIQ